MKLRELAHTVSYGGEDRLVVDDGTVLAWAEREKIPPWEAQNSFLEEGVLPLRYLKNLQGIDLSDQQRLGRSSVFICGCGGLGGVIAQLLARCGVGHLRIADGDRFELTNCNRQWFCHSGSLGRSKARAGAEQLAAMNPLIRIEALEDTFRSETAAVMLDGADAAMDALDNLETRFFLEEACRARGIPLVHGAVAGWWGQLVTLLPDSRCSLSDLYGGRKRRDPAEEAMGVLGVTASLVGSLQAMEALRLLLHRPPAYADRFVYFDGDSGLIHAMALSP